MRTYKTPIVEIKTIIKEDVLLASPPTGEKLIQDGIWTEGGGTGV